MRLEILKGPGLSAPMILEDVARVLILGDLGTPLGVAVEWSPGCVVVSTAAEGDGFTQMMAGLGLDRTVVATPVRLSPQS